MQTEPSQDVRVMRLFTAPPERVFDAWLEPKMIANWMFGPNVRDEEVIRIAVDARVGGRFSFLVRRHGEEIDHIGEYLEIKRPERLSFTWATAQGEPDVSQVGIEIEPMETGCELTLVHTLHPDWAQYANRTEAAWTKMLDALAAALRKIN